MAHADDCDYNQYDEAYGPRLTHCDRQFGNPATLEHTVLDSNGWRPFTTEEWEALEKRK